MKSFDIIQFRNNMMALIDQMKRGCTFDENTLHYATLEVQDMVDALSFYDVRFDIHNIAYFYKSVGKVFGMGKKGEYGVCFFNISAFSLLNKKFGFDNGTNLMYLFLKELQEQLDEEAGECVCSVGGDNAVCLFKSSNIDLVMSYLTGHRVKSGEIEVIMKTVSGFLEDMSLCNSPLEVLQLAQPSYIAAKYFDHVPYKVYESKSASSLEEAKKLSVTFEKSLEERNFKITYVPIINLNTYTVSTVKARCTWQNEGKTLTEKDYTKALEFSNKICDLDFFVLNEVCMDLKRIFSENLRPLPVTVRFNGKNFLNPLFSNDLINVIDSYGIPRNLIQIEFDQTGLPERTEKGGKMLFELSQAGIDTILAEFGSGRSTPLHLERSPWTYIKPCRDIVKNLFSQNERSSSFSTNLLHMITDLGVQVIAEDIESLEEIALLKQNKFIMASGKCFDEELSYYEYKDILKENEK